jgi:isopenicillin-N epimerase
MDGRAAPQPARSEWGVHWTLDPAVTYLNHGSFGACPAAVLAEQARLRALLEADAMAFYFELGPLLWQAALQSLAQFLGADAGGLAFVTNASTGVNTVLRSIRWQPGDEILLLDHAYQACRNAVDRTCRDTGARAVVVALPFTDLDDDTIVRSLLGAVTSQTRLALLDTVTSPTALRLPFERLVAELQGRNIDVLLDAAHGPGIVPLDLAGIGAAYVTGNCHKWLCTPKGSGFLHVRADRRDRVEPLVTSHGYSAQVSPDEKFRREFDWPGTQDPTPWLCIPFAIQWLDSLTAGGVAALRDRNRALALSARDLVAEALGIRPPVDDALLVSMASLPIAMPAGGPGKTVLDGDPLVRKLFTAYDIETIVLGWPAHGVRYLRISAAPYNSLDEYRYLARALTELGVAGVRATR